MASTVVRVSAVNSEVKTKFISLKSEEHACITTKVSIPEFATRQPRDGSEWNTKRRNRERGYGLVVGVGSELVEFR